MSQSQMEGNTGFEVLAPAGSLEIFKAVVDAGADAVYVGGTRFGARAYANNFSEEELLEALDYAHVRGKKVYLTLNTLLKNSEIGEVREYLRPYYERGLDAVLVQDFGVLNLIRRWYPDLPVHTSTQMTVCGAPGTRLLAGYGVTRVVMARELSIDEMKRIHEDTGMELEAFVHGALCYCYSGQCLFSSILGGRSGNRGRCAQPCRLSYRVYDAQGQRLKDECFILSLKDLCGISDLPKLHEAGVYSLKIEGRMKQKSYAMGVVSYYRKYADMCLKNKEFSVTGDDKKSLAALGSRCGFTDAYYTVHNSSDMVTYEKPSFTQQDMEMEIEPLRIPVDGYVYLKEGEPSMFTVTAGEHTVTVTGEAPLRAKNQPVSEEDVKKRFRKTGDTAFAFAQLEVCMEDGLFLPNGQMNQLRRDGLEALKQEILKPYQRVAVPGGEASGGKAEIVYAGKSVRQTVLVSEETQLSVVLGYDFVTDIYLDLGTCPQSLRMERLKQSAARCRDAGKHVYYVMPAVFRLHTQEDYSKHEQEIMAAGLDGFVVKSYDSLAFVKEHFPDKQIITDHNLYTYNDDAAQAFYELGAAYDTVPVELNKKELMNRSNGRSELIVYGYYPLMTSAQCVHKNTAGCDKCPQVVYLEDRYHVRFPVKNCCGECYNVIYNSLPVMLFGQLSEIERMNPAGYRLDFTVESAEETAQVMKLYEEFCFAGRSKLPQEWKDSYTNGHYKRGVE